MIYAGIGSRETPAPILDLMGTVARRLNQAHWVLRTGGASGADEAFAVSALTTNPDRVELYYPWPRFSNIDPDLAASARVLLNEPQPEAIELAAHFHPRWQYLTQGAKKLHARNVHQVLGPDVSSKEAWVPVDCIVCYTKNGKGMGGTGQAIRIATSLGIPVYDFGHPLTGRLLIDMLSG